MFIRFVSLMFAKTSLNYSVQENIKRPFFFVSVRLHIPAMKQNNKKKRKTIFQSLATLSVLAFLKIYIPLSRLMNSVLMNMN